jgi:hypothetical protein
MQKLQIGVLLYSKIGTNTSILLDEFKFFNDFQKFNPDCEFVFVSLSEYVTKSIIKHKSLLQFPLNVLKVYSREDFHKLDGLSGVFSYMTRNCFFGGNVDKPTILNYDISSHCTNELNIPLFIRTPDSEYPYLDYKLLLHNRVTLNKPESCRKFEEQNRDRLQKMPEKYINYDNVYFVANGSRKICDWVVDIAYNDLPIRDRILKLEEIPSKTLYVSDEILFNVSRNYQKYSYLEKKSIEDKFIFIGYLRGTVARNRLKALPAVFKENIHTIPTDIIGPGANELLIDRPDVNLIDGRIHGDKFFETLNKYLAYIFVGKGNPTNKYINKTVYDCLSARCPVIVYSKCDKTELIFEDKEFYFSTEDELFTIYEKLKNPEIRKDWIDRQYKEITNKLETLMDPMFKFSDYCKPKSAIKIDFKVEPLF